MRVKFTVEAEVERISGKFASKDEIEGEIQQALDEANPGSVSGVGADGDSEYEVNDWTVQPS